MVIKNITSVVQKVSVEDIFDGRVYDVYIEPHGVTTLSGVILLGKDKLSGIIESVTPKRPEVSLESVQETPSLEDESAEEDTQEETTAETSEELVVEEEEVTPIEETTSETTPAPQVNESQFICDICKAEFASARGLASHKNRAHPHES